MKKLLVITTLGLFCFGTAQATTLYCDYHQWNDYVVLNIDYKNIDPFFNINTKEDFDNAMKVK